MLTILLFALLAATAGAQPPKQALECEQIASQLADVLQKLPKDIYEADRMYAGKSFKYRFDTLKTRIEAEYKRLAESAGGKSLWLNELSYAGRTGNIFEPVNQQMADQVMLNSVKADTLQTTFLSCCMKWFKEKGLYKGRGYLPVRDSIYKSRRAPLLVYGQGMLSIIKREVQMLKENQHMMASAREEEKIQYYETQGWVLMRLSQLNGLLMQVVVTEAGQLVSACREDPKGCKQIENL
jgi:hypothetical protein